MTETPRQLALDLQHRDALGEEDFLVSRSNATAVALVDQWPHWPTRAAVISGPAGAGKSHLVNVWRMRSGAHVAKASDISIDAVPEFASHPALAVEDLDKGPLDEKALFHLLNLVRENKLSVLITCGCRPGDLVIALPDLSSRLNALTIAEIEPPDDALLSAVLVKHFADRQLAVEPAVVSYCLVRMERSMDAARRLVARIDALGLEMQRRVTRALAAEALDALHGEAGAE